MATRCSFYDLRVAGSEGKGPSALARPGSFPFVLVNMAMTADGKIATPNRAVSSFGSQRDQEHLYELRATADAVMAGARTVDLNEIKLGPGPARFRKIRLAHHLAEYPLRVIVSGAGTVDPKAVLFRHRFEAIGDRLENSDEAFPGRRGQQSRYLPRQEHDLGRSLRVEPEPRQRLRDVDGLQARLHERILRVTDLRIDVHRSRADVVDAVWAMKQESGRPMRTLGSLALSRSLLQAGLVDELHLTVCPKIFGGRDAPTIADGQGARSLSQAADLELRSFKRVGDELFLVYRARKPRVAV